MTGFTSFENILTNTQITHQAYSGSVSIGKVFENICERRIANDRVTS